MEGLPVAVKHGMWKRHIDFVGEGNSKLCHAELNCFMTDMRFESNDWLIFFVFADEIAAPEWRLGMMFFEARPSFPLLTSEVLICLIWK